MFKCMYACVCFSVCVFFVSIWVCVYVYESLCVCVFEGIFHRVCKFDKCVTVYVIE